MRQRKPKYIPREKQIEYFVVQKYDEASDAKRTDKLPHKKVWHENTNNMRYKGSH